MIIPSNEQTAIFGANEGVWEYCSYDGELICYMVRYFKWKDGKQDKDFRPWTYQDEKWKKAWYPENHPLYSNKPLYQSNLLKLYPEKSILLVEGEKAANAAQLLFSDLICTTWPFGAGSVNQFDITYLKDRKVIIWPDNDTPGQKAAKRIKERLKNHASYVGIVEIKHLGLPEKWDLADFNDEHDTIDLESLQITLDRAWNQKNILELIDADTFPLRSTKNKPINAYENINHMLQFYGMNTRFNVIKKEIEVDIPHKQFTRTNKSKLILAELTSLCIKNDIPRIDLSQWIMMIADENSYNPVEQFLKSKPWDGISRINDFLNTVDCDDIALRNLLIKKWMIGAIATALSPNGLAHPGVLTLCGKQYCGKSSWFKSLVPSELDLILGDHGLNPSDKDSVRTATRFWLTELSEVDGAVRRSDVSAMKSFLTRQLDVYRCPYDRADTEAPRNTAFVATVNDEQFLRDNTGNRRWWVLEVISMNAEHNLDMQQIWAEFYCLYLKGQSFYLDKDEFEMLNISNKKYSMPSSLEEILNEKFHWHEQQRTIKMSATEVLNVCGFDVKNGKQEPIKECHRILKLLTGKSPKKINGKTVYCLPPVNHQAKWI